VTDDFGPFSVDPAQLTGLGGALFQELVNRLLAAEVASAGLSSTNLRTSYQSNVKDQGVDARLEADQATEWVPTGDSAWQFKAGTLGPEGCADELAEATFAHEILRNGGTYRLVLGKGLEAKPIEDREAKLREKAAELGFDVGGDRFKVIDGNQLARWIEQYPALAVSAVIRGIGHVAIDFQSWTRKAKHRFKWVQSAERDELRVKVLEFLARSVKFDLRIEGESGLGKSRGTLEALRGSKYQSLVVYVGDSSEIQTSLINHFARQRRSAILVVDECSRKRHKAFAEQLEVDSPVRLITIGNEDTSQPQFQPLGLSTLPDDVIDKVLSENFPSLWPEARRLVVGNCAGNVGWALFLAEAILKDPKTSVADLIDAAGLRNFILSMVASESDYSAVSALALLTRYGVDGDMEAELEQLAVGLNLPLSELKAATRRLDKQGLLSKQGRYRAVTPQPLAVLLASLAWEEFGDTIVNSLLPTLNGSMSKRLFLRAAQIGSSGPAAVALNKILNPDGPFGSLASIASEGNSHLLIELAIIAPSEVAAHLADLIDAATDSELREIKTIRRNLVWTLEKLVWHSATFEIAANMLLRLALAENETFSNNATGTWVNLFGGMLPATAASPSARLAYLEAVANDQSAGTRKLAVAAADHAIDAHGGTVMVSGELQGGVVVEPQGSPTEWAEFWSYTQSAIELLRKRAVEDPEPYIREAATKALVDAIHPFLDSEAIRGALFDALASLPPEGLRRVWTEINHLRALFDHVDTPEFSERVNATPELAPRRAGLDLLVERLPTPGALDELKVLSAASRWEWDDGELKTKIIAVAKSLPPEEATASLLALSAAIPPPEASFEVGAALYAVAAGDETLTALAALADNSNIAGLTGYLLASVDDGDVSAFDTFLDGPVGERLQTVTRLSLTVRGPRSESGWHRALRLQAMLPVRVGAPRMFGWHTGVEPKYISQMLQDWLQRIEAQSDYNAAVNVTAMMLFRQPELNQDMEASISELVNMRLQFGEIGQQGYDWVQLARRQLATDPDALLQTLLRQVDSGSLSTFEGSEELRLLQETMAAAGPGSIGKVLDMVEAGSWRIQMDFRGWLTDVYTAADLIDWIGDDVDRARLVASMTGIGKGSPSDAVGFLLTRFGSDDKVSSALYGNFITGTWWGNESVRLNGQITQLSAWVNDRELSAGVKDWARDVIGSLKKRLETVLLEEAEEDRA
jgi:hypothetical protein